MAKGDKAKKTKKTTARQYVLEAGYAMELINSDPSLQEWLRRIRQYMDTHDNRVPTEYELDDLKQGIEWFEKYNADQELARMQQADPRRAEDWARSLELAQQKVQALANNYGVTLDPEELATIASDVRLNQLTDLEIQAKFGPLIEAAIVGGEDIGGQAAEYERNILQWAQRNGLSLSGQTVANYVRAGTEGRSTLEDIKNDLRRTYMMGAYPSWADRISEGQDIADIAAPYRQSMADLLEINTEDIGFDDPLLRRGLQGVGADGKPRVVPVYEFEQMVRQDDRWQRTDNAYATYAGVAQNLLRTFGYA